MGIDFKEAMLDEVKCKIILDETKLKIVNQIKGDNILADYAEDFNGDSIIIQLVEIITKYFTQDMKYIFDSIIEMYNKTNNIKIISSFKVKKFQLLNILSEYINSMTDNEDRDIFIHQLVTDKRLRIIINSFVTAIQIVCAQQKYSTDTINIFCLYTNDAFEVTQKINRLNLNVSLDNENPFAFFYIIPKKYHLPYSKLSENDEACKYFHTIYNNENYYSKMDLSHLLNAYDFSRYKWIYDLIEPQLLDNFNNICDSIKSNGSIKADGYSYLIKNTSEILQSDISKSLDIYEILLWLIYKYLWEYHHIDPLTYTISFRNKTVDDKINYIIHLNTNLYDW